MIKFDAKAKIIIVDELSEAVVPIVAEEKAKVVLIVIDENVARHDQIGRLVSALNNPLVEEIKAIEPTVKQVNLCLDKLRGREIDLVIGIGGGSVLDLAKAIAVMLVNEGEVEDYHGTGKPFTAGLKKIMVPTTAGTGSEVTHGAVLVNEKTSFKRGIGGWYVGPEYAVLCPILTLTMPMSVTAATGMDALGHAIEAYTTKCANEITRMYAKTAFALLFKNLENVLEHPSNIELRRSLLLGSCLAGYSIYNSNTGACHSMAYPLGIYKKVPHGVAVANLLPKVVAVNIEKGCQLYADLYDLIEPIGQSMSVTEKQSNFSRLLSSYQPLKWIKTLGQFDIEETDIAFLSERGLDLRPALDNNPVEFNLDDAKRCLKEAL